MAQRANDTWRAEDGTLFDGENARARAKRHDAWCELVEHAADIISILKAGPANGGA